MIPVRFRKITLTPGILGKPVWVLDYGKEFRWRGEGDRSTWFPSARVFQQETPGEWGQVVERVGRELLLVKAAA